MVTTLPEGAGKGAAPSWLGRIFNPNIPSARLAAAATQAEAKRANAQYASILARKKRLLALEKRKHEELTQAEHWELAVYTELYRAPASACAQYQAYHERFPEDDNAAFAMGRLLLAQGDETGLFKLTRACRNPKLIEKSCSMAYKFLAKQGRDQEAEFWRTKAQRQKEINRVAKRERASVSVGDGFEAPNLSPAYLQRLAKLLGAHPKVDQVWLAQKKVKHFPEEPVIVFAVSLKGYTFSKDRVLNDLLRSIKCEHTLFGVVKGGRSEGICRKIFEHGTRVK
ncbi:MAG: hypothetical protein AB1810_14570 [Pseudomonadota bacterium]